MTQGMPVGWNKIRVGRLVRAGVLALGVWGVLLCGSGRVQAREGDTQTLIYVGTSFVTIEGDSTEGASIGARWGYEFADDLLWTVGAAFTSTDGKKSVNGQDYALKTSSTSLQTGLLYYFGRAPGKMLVPFVGGGIAALNYDIDYTFPGSKVGKTNGTAPGGFAFAGVELLLARALTVIVSYEADVYQIDRQGGGSSQLDSGGIILALRFNFYSG